MPRRVRPLNIPIRMPKEPAASRSRNQLRRTLGECRRDEATRKRSARISAALSVSRGEREAYLKELSRDSEFPRIERIGSREELIAAGKAVDEFLRKKGLFFFSSNRGNRVLFGKIDYYCSRHGIPRKQFIAMLGYNEGQDAFFQGTIGGNISSEGKLLGVLERVRRNLYAFNREPTVQGLKFHFPLLVRNAGVFGWSPERLVEHIKAQQLSTSRQVEPNLDELRETVKSISRAQAANEEHAFLLAEKAFRVLGPQFRLSNPLHSAGGARYPAFVIEVLHRSSSGTGAQGTIPLQTRERVKQIVDACAPLVKNGLWMAPLDESGSSLRLVVNSPFRTFSEQTAFLDKFRQRVKKANNETDEKPAKN